MSSNAVVEVVHLRLHAADSYSFPLARLATPDLPPSLLRTWGQICSSASKAGGHHFGLYRSVDEPAEFFFIGGWDDPAEHAKVIARSRDSLLAASLGKWMEHISVRHVRADLDALDNLKDGDSNAMIKEWKVDVDQEASGKGQEIWTKGTDQCLAGWDISNDVQSKHPEFKNMAHVLDGNGEVFQTNKNEVQKDGKIWVGIKFGPASTMMEEVSKDEIASRLMSFVLGASPDESSAEHIQVDDEIKF